MQPLSPKQKTVYDIIAAHVAINHRGLMEKLPRSWFTNSDRAMELSNVLTKLKQKKVVTSEFDKQSGVTMYSSVVDQPETPMNTLTDTLADTLPEHPAESFVTGDEPPERTIQDVAREFVIEVAAETVVSSEHLPASSEHLPPICSDLPADVETLTVYRVRGTDKCFETAAEVLGYRAELNNQRFKKKVSEHLRLGGFDVVLSPGDIQTVMDYIVACGGKIEIPEVSA